MSTSLYKDFVASHRHPLHPKNTKNSKPSRKSGKKAQKRIVFQISLAF